MEIYFTSS